ncbi:MAG: rubredoxin-like domain-containing protein [Chloroflexota bacterium]
MKELVRCKACGFVMEAGKLKDVCPACGMPAKVFEPYRERVALNRLFVLSLDMHPIAIHLSQTFVFLIPFLLFMRNVFPRLQPELFGNVLTFSLYAFPLTLLAAVITGVTDGLFRFKSLTPPLLRLKIVFSLCITILAITMFFVARTGRYDLVTILLSLGCLYFAVRLGLLGKKLLNVILPGMFPVKKPKVDKKQ